MCLEINLTTREQLDIYMNVQRLRLLKIMDAQEQPLTPKQISRLMDISPSSVTYHLNKLGELGLVALDHTEKIHGIEAKFYKRVPAIVNLKGNVWDDLQPEKMVLANYMVNDIWSGFRRYAAELSRNEPGEPDTSKPAGDCIAGTFYLTDEEARKVKELIMGFQRNHIIPSEQTHPWEVALVAFPTSADKTND